MSRTFKVPTKPYDDVKIYNRATVTFEPGVSVLVGCNGIGKSTLMSFMKESLDSENVPYTSWNDRNDGRYMTDLLLYSGDLRGMGMFAFSSEGEKIVQALGRIANKLGNEIHNEHEDASEYWVFLDAVDSGFSIDNVEELKEFFELLLNDKPESMDVYIIVSANAYAMAKNEKCFDVLRGKYVEFDSYEDYEKFVIATRKRKDKRYA